MHYIGADIGVARSLKFRDKSLNFIQALYGFHSQCSKLLWIPRSNTCNVNFVGALVLSLTPQKANIARCSEFRKCKRMPQM